MDAFLLGQVAQILGGQETGHQALGFVAVSNHVAHFQQRLPDILIHLRAGAIHGCEITTGNKGNFIPIRLVITRNLFADRNIIGTFIMQRQPGKGPGHFRTRKPLAYRVAERRHGFGRMDGCFVVTFAMVACRLDLVHPDQRVQREKTPPLHRQGFPWRRFGCGQHPADKQLEQYQTSENDVSHLACW